MIPSQIIRLFYFGDISSGILTFSGTGEPLMARTRYEWDAVSGDWTTPAHWKGGAAGAIPPGFGSPEVKKPLAAPFPP